MGCCKLYNFVWKTFLLAATLEVLNTYVREPVIHLMLQSFQHCHEKLVSSGGRDFKGALQLFHWYAEAAHTIVLGRQERTRVDEGIPLGFDGCKALLLQDYRGDHLFDTLIHVQRKLPLGASGVAAETVRGTGKGKFFALCKR